MNKSELITQVAERASVSKKDATRTVDALLDVIQDALQRGEHVQLVGFGNFEVRARNERRGRNPQTGEEILIAASRVPSFRAGKTLRECVQTL